mmetsp:Transcript_96705/g.278288  ORF Transcript_96705/g.278288 Transcript_96705/m.278288 type:complete len:308 (+) Transcript_96705:1797-2720(+)
MAGPLRELHRRRGAARRRGSRGHFVLHVGALEVLGEGVRRAAGADNGGGVGLQLAFHVRHPRDHDFGGRLEHFADRVHLLRRWPRRLVLHQGCERVAAEPNRAHDREDGDDQRQPVGGDEIGRLGVQARRGRAGPPQGGARTDGQVLEVDLPAGLHEEAEGADGDSDAGEDDHQARRLARDRLRRGGRGHRRPQHAGLHDGRGQHAGAGHEGRCHHRLRQHPQLRRSARGSPREDHAVCEPGRGDRARLRGRLPWGAEQERRRLFHGGVEVDGRAARRAGENRGYGDHVFREDRGRGQQVPCPGGVP